MAREPSQKLVDYGIIAGIAIAAFFIWNAFFKKEAPKECPPGQHAVNPCEGQLGWPAFLCNLGRNVTGAFLDCKPDTIPGGTSTPTIIPGVDLVCPDGTVLENGICKPVNVPAKPLPLDSFGCVMGLQKWCPIDKKCMDQSRSCTPDPALIPSPGACYEWSPTFHKWLYSPSMPGCDPASLKPVLPQCAESECTPGTAVCVDGISKVCEPLGTGCEDKGIWARGGNACKPATLLKQCPTGAWVDLNNPPGITLEEACAGSGVKNITNRFYDDCMRSCGQTAPGQKMCKGTKEQCAAFGATVPLADGLYANQLAIDIGAACKACETDTSRNALATRADLTRFVNECQAAGNQVMGWSGSEYTSKGHFTDPYEWARAFGHSLTGELTKGYQGNPDTYPGSNTIYCFRRGS